jgi:DNA-binding MurR/RpiR family transcriptional regulator
MESAKKDLFDKIIRVYASLSPKKKRVADLIMNDYKNVFFMTAREIAEKCNVSEPTVIRLSVDIGFSGYAEFLQYMKGLFHTELTSAERLRHASRNRDEGTTIQRYCQNAIFNLNNLMTSFSSEEFTKTARAIYQARRVYVIGYRASATLAYHFGYLLKKVRENVVLDTNLSWELMDDLNERRAGSLLIAIAFPRYPLKTIETVKYAKLRGVKTLGISDNARSPVITLSDLYVILDIEGVSFVDPFAHIIAFLGALVHEIASFDNKEAIGRLSNFDKGVKAAGEFYTEDESDQQLAYRLNRPQLTSLWPQKEVDSI